MNYTVMLGEIICEDLKKEQLTELKKFLESAFKYLNHVFPKSLKVKTILRKEDFQGVFDNSVAAFLYYRILKMLIYPVQIRVGLGEGKFYPEEINSADVEGPAHFNAHRALSLSENKNRNITYISFNKSDKYLNSLLESLDYLEKKNTISNNLIKLMAELYFPIFKRSSMDFFEYQEEKNLLKTLEYKEKFYNWLIETDPSIKGTYPDAKKFRLPKLDDCEIYDYEDLYGKEKSEVIDCYWKRGFSTKIANSLNNTSRQNVDKHLEYGIILQRNLEGGICLFLAEKK